LHYSASRGKKLVVLTLMQNANISTSQPSHVQNVVVYAEVQTTKNTLKAISLLCPSSKTRKLSYRKDDRAMRPMCECPEKFRQS